MWQILYSSYDWLFHVSSIRQWSLWLGWFTSLFSSAVAAITLVSLCLRTAPKTSDWLMSRGLWIKQARWLDLGWGAWRAAVSVAMGLNHAGHGGEGKVRKKYRTGGVGGASISLWLISAHASPETAFFQAKWRAHRDNLTVFLLSFSAWTELHSLSVSLRQLIMMSILSYLPGFGWLLISD